MGSIRVRSGIPAARAAMVLALGALLFSCLPNEGVVATRIARQQVGPTPAPPSPLPSPAPYTGPCGTRRIPIAPGADGGRYYLPDWIDWKPGDTLALQPGNWTYFALVGFRATAECPLRIVNDGAPVRLTAGFGFTDSSHIELDGTGAPGTEYGFSVENPSGQGAAISISGTSEWIEAHHVSVTGTMYGVWAKHEADCDPKYQYPNWVIDHVTLRNLRISNVGQSAMYLGSTDPNGHRGVSCNGVMTYPLPLRLGHFSIHDNIIRHTGRSGIQLSDAELGTSEIHHNDVAETGWELNNQQGNGISLGGYTRAWVHHNRIRNTFIPCIMALGTEARIENNDVAGCGYLGTSVAQGMDGIMIDTRETIPVTLSTFQVRDNAIGTVTGVGVRVYDSWKTFGTANTICRNGGTLAIDPGVRYGTSCE
jgi:hypothetical protein